MPTPSDHGIVNLSAQGTVAETTERLTRILESRGMTIFARIDQQVAAKTAHLDMQPMVLIIFGNPRTGTPLMQKYPSLAIDLPLKVLIWEDATGQVRVSYNSLQYLKERHALAEVPFQAVEEWIAQAI
ncbi:MAG: DUF302 domain-containing protein [Sulfuricaulis sp.]